MAVSRRRFMATGATAALSAALPLWSSVSSRPSAVSAPQEVPAPLPAAFDTLKPLGNRVQPISTQEYSGRIALAQRLMNEAKPKFSALYLTPGTSLFYYTGLHWFPSERLLAVLIPRRGDAMVICPAFEESRLRELLPWPMQIRTWQEDEDPYALAAEGLASRGIRTGRIAVEETTRYVFFDGLRRAAPGFEFSSAAPVTVGCRAQKTAHELQLMRLACEATFDVYRALFASLREGLTERDVAGLLSRGFAKMGLRGDALVLFGASAALPHGTREPQRLKQGQVVLIDGGTAVEGYQSDVTRCSVLGPPPDTLKRAFDIARKAQDAALLAAVPAARCGSVDDAARKIITDAGFGPGYKFFTHRLGHGIGLDGHEQPYLVRGNRTLLRPSMTFSNEPGIYVPGQYGLRLEDDMVISESGAAELLTPGFSPSLEKPIA